MICGRSDRVCCGCCQVQKDRSEIVKKMKSIEIQKIILYF